jgi:hypothetical protein
LFVQLVFAMSRLSRALLVLGSSCVFASDWQAGKPLEVHVDYDVPAGSSAASSVLRGRGRVQPFSAMSLQSGAGVVPEQGADVTVHVPSVALGAGERAAWLSGLQSDVAALAAVDRSQAVSEERVRGIARQLGFVRGSSFVAGRVSDPGPGEYVLNLLPPRIDDHEAGAALDDVMRVGEAHRVAAEEIAAGDQQQMLDIERAEIRRIVRDGLA